MHTPSKAVFKQKKFKKYERGVFANMDNKNAVKQAKRLIGDIRKKIASWNERSQFKLRGVNNLSRSDLDTLELYAQTFIRNGGYGFSGLMQPRGSIKAVLDKYGLVEQIENY
jgi:hypothetical protein